MTSAERTNERALRSVRVVDLSDDVAGAYGARMLAAVGADVIKVEPPEGDWSRTALEPGGDPEAGILFSYLGSGKRSVVLDAAQEADRNDLLRLLRSADVIIESGAPGEWAERGVDLAALLRERPALVVCSVTPFGQDGPRANWRTTALTAFASGGQMMLCGDPGRGPLKTAGFQAAYQTGLHVFSSVVTALFGARRTGAGDHIDISMQEAQAACLEGFGPTAMVNGFDTELTGNALRATWGIYACKDGYIGVAAMQRQTASVYKCIGRPELADDPAFVNVLANPEMNDVVELFIGEWAAERTAAEIYAEADRFRAPFSLIPTPRELLELPGLQQANFWAEVEHPVLGKQTLPGIPFDIDGWTGTYRAAPRLGEHTREVLDALPAEAPAAETAAPEAPALPLAGVRVLDLTQVWAGPYGTRFLGDMGADVIHIEGPAFPDVVRGIGRPDVDRPFDRAPYFNEYNRNKRSLVLDLHTPEGLAAFKRMVPQVDIVIENWSAGVADRLGVGYAALRELNPKIVFVQMPGYGQTGPDASRVGFGPAIEQMGGLVNLQGYQGDIPHKSGISYGDPTAGTVAAGATALGLLVRDQRDDGCHIIVRQRDNIIGLIGEYIAAEVAGTPLPTRLGNSDPHMAPHNVYQAADDEGRTQANIMGQPIAQYHETWLAIAVDSDNAWQALKWVLDDTRLDNDAYDTVDGRKAAEAEIDAVIGEWVRARPALGAATTLQEAGVSAMPVLSPLMLTRDDHLNARGFYPTCHHPVAGSYLTTAPVWRLKRRPFDGTMMPAPGFGQHNREVLSALGGFSEAEIEGLAERGVIATEPRS